ncbi:hypothetical protein ACEPAH_1066 [Sanghuangporus vaninii]
MTGKTNEGAVNGLSSDQDLASLAALLDESSDEHADQNLAEILARLDGANSIAQQMEDNLDKILQRLDGILEGIEATNPSESETKEDKGNSSARYVESTLSLDISSLNLPVGRCFSRHDFRQRNWRISTCIDPAYTTLKLPRGVGRPFVTKGRIL